PTLPTRRSSDLAGNRLGITRRAQIDDALTGETTHFAFVFVDRVAGEVQAQGVLLALQALLECQFPRLAVVGIDIRLGLGEQAAEEIHMAAFLATRRLLGGLDRLLHGRQQYRAILVDAGLIELRVIGEVRP